MALIQMGRSVAARSRPQMETKPAMPWPQLAPITSAPASVSAWAVCSGVLPIIVRSLSFPLSKTMQAITGKPVSRAALTASFASSRSDMVSTTRASAWAAASARACSANAARSSSSVMSPFKSSLPVGPMEAKTRARPPAAAREISTPRALISATWFAADCSLRRTRFAPKVLVRITWLPAET